MEVKHRYYENTLYLVLSGELDEHSATYVRETMDNLFDKFKSRQVIIDLSEMEFMDSTGIGMLIGRYKKLKEDGIPIYICNPSMHAEKIFMMTGLYDIMPKIG